MNLKYPQPLVAVMADVVAKTSEAVLPFLPAGITGVRYDYGHWLELQENINELDNSPKIAAKKSKYPVIMLLEDVPINRTGDGYYGTATFTMLIATNTQPQWKSAERQVKTFDPILDPIYQELLNQIMIAPYFVVSGVTPEHTVTDRKYMGRIELYGNNGNKLIDFIDAKELTGLRLTLGWDSCLQAINIFEQTT